MGDGRQQPLAYGVQKTLPEVADVSRRLKRLFTVIAVVWSALMAAVKIYMLIRNDPAE